MSDQITMQRVNHAKLWAAGAILAGGLVLGAVTNAPGAIADFTLARFMNGSSIVQETGAVPARIEPIAGSDISRVTLSQPAATRLRIQTAPVTTRTVNGANRLTVPFAAVLYDSSGGTWVYTNPQPLVFVRAPIAIERIDGDTAILAKGPAAGVQGTTVGTAELSGAEKNIGSLGE
jgi:hypothetical protein